MSWQLDPYWFKSDLLLECASFYLCTFGVKLTLSFSNTKWHTRWSINLDNRWVTFSVLLYMPLLHLSMDMPHLSNLWGGLLTLEVGLHGLASMVEAFIQTVNFEVNFHFFFVYAFIAEGYQNLYVVNIYLTLALPSINCHINQKLFHQPKLLHGLAELVLFYKCLRLCKNISQNVGISMV